MSLNQSQDNKYHYVYDNGKVMRVRKQDGKGNAISLQSALLRKMESDFENSKECIDFIDNLRK